MTVTDVATPEVYSLILGDRFREIRRGLGETQETMAELVDVALSTWRAWELGTRRPSIEYLVAMTPVLRVRPGALLAAVDEMAFATVRVNLEDLAHTRGGLAGAARWAQARLAAGDSVAALTTHAVWNLAELTGMHPAELSRRLSAMDPVRSRRRFA